MFERIKNCLLFPKQISLYLKERNIYSWIQFIILLLISCIPAIVMVTTSNSSSLIVDECSKIVSQSNVDYYIKDYKLNADIQEECYQQAVTTVNGVLDLGINFVYSSREGYYAQYFNGNQKHFVLLALFNPSGLHISFCSGDLVYHLFDYSFEELNVKDLDFRNVSSAEFKKAFNALANEAYSKIRKAVMPFIVIYVALEMIFAGFISMVLISLIVKLLFRGFGLKYGLVFKAAMLCSVPYFLMSMLSEITNFMLLELLGDILLAVYLFKCLFAYIITNGIKPIYQGGFVFTKKEPSTSEESEEESNDSGDENNDL